MVNPRVFLDFGIGEPQDRESIGRLIFELFADTVPKTAENFRALCTGEKGRSANSSVPLYYKNSTIHRSINDFMVQGGDFTKHNGSGGESIYGGQFDDEDLEKPLDSAGLLCMANKGPNTNGSQFFITLRECPHLNGKHVVFGRIIRGFDDVIPKIMAVPTDKKDKPTIPVVIVNCGELELRASARVKSKEKEKNKKSKSHRRSRSRSPQRHKDDEGSRSRRRSRPRSPSEERKSSSKPVEETEEEYDARLEREEKERLAQARLRELERMKRRVDDKPSEPGVVRFKGRGRMQFVDPEHMRRR